MASSKTMLATLALFLFLATPQPSHALIIDGINILQIRVLGTLFCTATGNHDPACGGMQQCPRLSGALVTISCNGGSTTLAQAVTDINGTFEVVLSIADGLLFDESKCAVFVRLPLARCALLPPTETLQGALHLLNVVPIALGGIARFTSLPFQVLSGLKMIL